MKPKDYERAWKTFKEKRTQEYVKLHRTVNNLTKPNSQHQLFQLANAMVGKKDLAHILKEMDRLDNTNDFSNLISDMGDE